MLNQQESELEHCGNTVATKDCPPADKRNLKLEKTLEHFRVECNGVDIVTFVFRTLARQGRKDCVYKVRDLDIAQIKLISTVTDTELFIDDETGLFFDVYAIQYTI